MTDAQKKIADKIQKLLNLAESSNEHEAALAADKAAQLLAEHNLSQSDVTRTTNMSTDEEIGLNDDNFTNSTDLWVRYLWQATAKLYFCEYVFSTEYGQTLHQIVGTPGNAQVAASMAHWLTSIVFSTTEAKSVPDIFSMDPTTAPRSKTWQKAFRAGCAGRITNRLIVLRKEKMTPHPTSANPDNLPALYADSAKAVQEWKANNMDTRTSRSRAQKLDAKGLAAGRAAGDRVQLSTQVSSNNSQTQGLLN